MDEPSFRFLTFDEYKALPLDEQETYLFAAIDHLNERYSDSELKARLHAEDASQGPPDTT